MNRIAIVHDWLETYSGAERVLEQIIKCYPDADIFTIVDFLPANQRSFLNNRPIKTSFIQNLPFAKKHFRKYLQLMPLAIEQFDLTAYDLVISSSWAFAKGVLIGPDQVHVSYIHTPIRYATSLQYQYLRQTDLDKTLLGLYARWLMHHLRIWDRCSSSGIDLIITNSNYISRRIKKSYGLESCVLPPPVDCDFYHPGHKKDDFYVTASRLVPYKRFDLIIDTFNRMPEKKLVVIGEGPEYSKLIKKANVNIKFLGYQEPELLRDYLQRAKAFIFAAEEDFGILPVEAQACGTPVIAYGKGGIRDSVYNFGEKRPTGVFFNQQNSESLIGAIKLFEDNISDFKPIDCINNAKKFTLERFRNEFKALVKEVYPIVRTGIC